VCSGTTSKQIARESHCHPIGYGAMLLEAFVALIALATVMMVDATEVAGKAPGAIYGAGLGRFLTVMIGEQHLVFATTFGSMAFSTFVFDTLDVSTRLGRYTIQELFGWTGPVGAVAATALTLALPVAFIASADAGAYRSFWTLFGTSNQLLAALTLLAISVWLKRSGRAYWFTLVPMFFVLTITLCSLVLQITAAFGDDASGVTTLNGVVALILMGLAAFLLTEAARSVAND
jgi:carbon starvation protein